MIAETAVPATVPAHDTTAAVDFLRDRVPDGLVALAAKRPDQGGMDCRTFEVPGEAAELAVWIDARQGVANVYWQVNAPRATAAQDRRCDAAAIRLVKAVWIDSDPRDGPGGDEEGPHGSDGWRRGQARLDGIVQSLQQSAAPPTVIIRSGYGRQALWWFEHPIDLDALDDEARKALVRDVRGQARGLEQLYASDGVNDLCRLLRLPFTVNLPDAGKRARGRLPSSATVLDLEATRLHSLDALAAVAAPIAAGKEAGTVDPQGLGEALSHLGTPDSLPAALRAAVDAELGKGKAFHTAVMRDVVQAQRSDRDFAIVCASVEAGWSDPEIACVFCAYSSGKIEDKMERGDGAALAHIAGEIARAKGKTSPAPPPFDPAPWLDHEAMAEVVSEIGPETRVPARRFRFESATDVAARFRGTGNSYLVKGLLDRGATGVIYGDSNVGKSFVMLHLAHHIARGAHYGGMKIHGGPVLYILSEGGSTDAPRRLEALRRRFGDAPNLFLLLTSIDLFDPKADIGPLLEEIAAFGQRFALIVVDTLARAIAGGDENSAKDMGQFIRHAELLKTVNGSTIVLVHHTGKDASKGARGSGSLRAATDTEIELTPGQITVTKQRSIPTNWSSPFTLPHIELGTDEDSDPIINATARLGPADAFDANVPAETVKISRKEQLVLDALGDLLATESDPAQLGNIADVVHKGESTRDQRSAVQKQLNALLGKGRVVKVAKGKYALKGADKASEEATSLLAEFG